MTSFDSVSHSSGEPSDASIIALSDGYTRLRERPWLRIVIVAYNSGNDLQNCIDAIARQSLPDFEVVIVDNDTPDDCIEQLKLPDSRFRVIAARENIGFAAGSNLGFDGATTPYFMAVNPDVRLKKNCLLRLKKAADVRPDVAMFTPVLLRATQKKRLDGIGDVLSIYGIAWRGGFNQKAKHFDLDQDHEIFAPCGAAAVYRRDVFERHGGFDNRFFCYLEDVDLGLRVNASGGSAVLVHNAKAYHVGSASTSLIPGFRTYYTNRNNPYLIIKSAPLGLLPFMLVAYAGGQIWITLRNLKDPITSHRLKGHFHGLLSVPAAVKARFRRKPYKFGSSLRIAKLLTWRRDKLRELHPGLWDVKDTEDHEVMTDAPLDMAVLKAAE